MSSARAVVDSSEGEEKRRGVAMPRKDELARVREESVPVEP